MQCARRRHASSDTRNGSPRRVSSVSCDSTRRCVMKKTRVLFICTIGDETATTPFVLTSSGAELGRRAQQRVERAARIGPRSPPAVGRIAHERQLRLARLVGGRRRRGPAVGAALVDDVAVAHACLGHVDRRRPAHGGHDHERVVRLG